MAMHLNDYGLKQEGFQLVAVYACFDKWNYSEYEKRWRYRKTTVKCYKSENAFLVRRVGRSTWDNVYKTAEEANKAVKTIIENHESHKREF